MTKTGHFLYRIQPLRASMLSEGPTAAESAIIARHFDYLEALLTRGVVIMAGRTLNTDATAFGLVILRANSADDASDIMGNDPVVLEGVMRAELFPYRIALPALSDDGAAAPA